MLSQVILLAALFSCSKKDIQDPPLPDETNSISAVAPSSTTTESKLLYKEDFEGSAPFSSYVSKQFPTSYSFTVATNPVFEGARSGRFELRDSDPMNNNGTRAEASFPVATNLNRWYSFSVYFPSADYKYDNSDELINQWHQHQHGTSSSISLRTKQDRYRLTIIPSYKATSEKIDLGAIAKDKWNTFVFHIKHSSGSDGLIEVWLNGQKVVNRTGSNMYSLSSADGLTNPGWKLGIYKSDWNNGKTTDTKKRVLYYDNIRLGNENATFTDMTSGAATTPPTTPTPPAPPTTPTPPTTTTPTPPTTSGSPVVSYTLVNASTEKDILTITNGATISLAKIGTSKLNIRANTASSVGSVKFELSGAQSKSFIDSKAPYALHGDDGKGNYYYGNWNPPALGTYTLKATPYSAAGGTGTAGTPYNISFTITK